MNNAFDTGFESIDDDGVPRGWTLRGADVAVVMDQAHGGSRSLRLHSDRDDSVTTATLVMPAAGLAGKHVRVHAWVRTRDVTHRASPWVRADAGERAFAYDYDNPVFGTVDAWVESVADIEVPPAQTLSLGVALRGRGTAWFDDVSIEVIEAAPQTPINLAGTVVDATGLPVAGAEVALLKSSGIVQHLRTDAIGAFSFRVAPGRYGFSATPPVAGSAVGGFTGLANYAADSTATPIVLGANDGVVVQGRLTRPFPSGATLEVARYSDAEGDLFAVPIDRDGQFRARLPRGDHYQIGLPGLGQPKVDADRIGDAVTASVPSAPDAVPASVVQWVAGHAVRMNAHEAGNGFEDMAGLDAIIGKARIVGLGEATHGSREMFQMKHRLFEYLVAKQGFTVLAFEANYVECLALDEYIQNGEGDLPALVSKLYWVWDTEEIMATIEWMRQWNASADHPDKIHLVGIDMQEFGSAYASIASFLARVAPDRSASLLAPVSIMGLTLSMQAIPKQSPEQQDALVVSLVELGKHFDRNSREWIAAASEAEYLSARHLVGVLQQAAAQGFAGPNSAKGSIVRDRAMADNVEWLVSQAAPGKRIAVWAHNDHIRKDPVPTGSVRRMGSYLHEWHADDYLALGMLFGHGSYAALDANHADNLEENALPPPPAYFASNAFSRAGVLTGALDLRRIPEGDVGQWFRAPQIVRSSGYRYRSEAALTSSQVLTERYDALVYLDKVGRSLAKPFNPNVTP